MDPVTGYLEASVRIATPLLWAAAGELVAERAGVINLGVEGAMLAGALAAALGAAQGDPSIGIVAAAMAGALVAALFAAVSIWGRSDQIIAGTAFTLASVGATGVIYRQAFGTSGVGLTLPTFQPLVVPGLSHLPFVGPAIFGQPILTYLAFAAVAAIWWVMFRTTTGLRLRATGEAASAAAASGIRTRWVQTGAVVFAGAMAGIGGGTLVLAQVGTFAERMTAGRGFIAIAVVVLGRWHPIGVLFAALGFGAASALQFAFQAMGLEVPYQFFLMLPYVVALFALARAVGRVRAPAGLGKGV